MSEPSPEAKQAALLEQQEHSRPNPHPVGYHVQEAIDTATAKVREELEQLRTASFHDVSESIARMVIEYVEGGIKLGTDWRNGLADVIALRLKRVQMDKDKQLAHQQPSVIRRNPNEDHRAAQPSTTLGGGLAVGKTWAEAPSAPTADYRQIAKDCGVEHIYYPKEAPTADVEKIALKAASTLCDAFAEAYPVPLQWDVVAETLQPYFAQARAPLVEALEAALGELEEMGGVDGWGGTSEADPSVLEQVRAALQNEK